MHTVVWNLKCFQGSATIGNKLNQIRGEGNGKATYWDELMRSQGPFGNRSVLFSFETEKRRSEMLSCYKQILDGGPGMRTGEEHQTACVGNGQRPRSMGEGSTFNGRKSIDHWLYVMMMIRFPGVHSIALHANMEIGLRRKRCMAAQTRKISVDAFGCLDKMSYRRHVPGHDQSTVICMFHDYVVHLHPWRYVYDALEVKKPNQQAATQRH